MSFFVTGIIAAGVTLIAAVGDAQAQRDAGKANQQISENNAKLSEQQAKDEAILGAREQQQSAWRTRAMIGQQKAAIASNNLDMDIGTPLDILGDTAMIGGADPHALVQALAATELAVETAVTVRDKVVEAYQEILRMPV